MRPGFLFDFLLSGAEMRIFFSPFHLCLLRELLLYLITLVTHSLDNAPSGRGIGTSERPIFTQYTTFARDRQPCPPRGIRNHLRFCGHRDRLKSNLWSYFSIYLRVSLLWYRIRCSTHLRLSPRPYM